MKNLAHYFAVFTLLFYSATSYAQLVYSPGSIFDPATGNIWKRYTSLEAGISNGFKPATIADASGLFLSYAPLNSGGVVPGYDPEKVRVTATETSPDGSYFSVDWHSTGYINPPYTASLVDAFGYNVEYAGGGNNQYLNTLATLVQDGNGWTPVLLKSITYSDHGRMWGTEIGIINPAGKDVRWDFDFHTNCGDEGFCFLRPGNPYLESNGALKLGGFLMVSAVPELPPGMALLAGLMCLSLIARNRKLRG